MAQVKKPALHDLIQKYLNAKEPAKTHLKKLILLKDPKWKEPK